MKNALISPNEKIYFENSEIGERVAQVEDQTFEIGLPLYWMPCADDVKADVYYLDNDGTIKLKPTEPTIDVTT